jgi:hypothetical protein
MSASFFKKEKNGRFVDFLSTWIPDVKEIGAEIKTMEKWDNKQNVIQEQKAWKLERQKIRRREKERLELLKSNTNRSNLRYIHWHTTNDICWFPGEKLAPLTHLLIK